MVWRRRSARYRAAAALVFIPLVAVIGIALLTLSACGSAAPGGAGQPRPSAVSRPASSVPSAEPSATLCGLIGQLNGLDVRRADALPQNHTQFTFPAEVTVTNRAAVQAVAEALCALPPLPAGVFNGPADFGITYQLVFSAGKRRLPAVTVAAGGLQTVRGLGRIRWLLAPSGSSARFWHTLGMAMGLRSASNATFAGTRPAGG
ncbi:MAG: hypothetical protein ACLQUT_12410 [Thermoleophilia bacterium]